MSEKVTTATIRKMKAEGTPITMLTAYDYSMAKILDEAGIDMILVGDSLGNVVLGYDSTLPVTMDDMVHHIKAVCRGASRAWSLRICLYVLPGFPGGGLAQCRPLHRGDGCQGGQAGGWPGNYRNHPGYCKRRNPRGGPPGAYPQYVHQLGGYRVQGKDTAAAEK